jgi:hypothetical protein
MMAVQRYRCPASIDFGCSSDSSCCDDSRADPDSPELG